VPTREESRQNAQDWLRLAATATDFFVQDALVRRAADCETKARAPKRPYSREDRHCAGVQQKKDITSA
jgi:hypothetical protein